MLVVFLDLSFMTEMPLSFLISDVSLKGFYFSRSLSEGRWRLSDILLGLWRLMSPPFLGLLTFISKLLNLLFFLVTIYNPLRSNAFKCLLESLSNLLLKASVDSDDF